LGLVKTSVKNNPQGRLLWQLHRVIEPVQVLSLRVTQGHFGEQEPKFGNRLLVHALVKFDTEQVNFHAHFFSP
jgi:protein MBA1